MSPEQGFELSAGATFLSSEDQQVLWNLTAADKNNDQGALVVEGTGYNVGVNVQHRVTPNQSAGGRMAFHQKVTEIYYVTDGHGTLVTAGGAMTDVELRPYSTDDVVKSNGRGMAGPGGSAIFTGAHQSYRLKQGDVIILPPYTGHYLSEVDGAFRYLVFRVDPEHTLPGSFVNEHIKH